MLRIHDPAANLIWPTTNHAHTKEKLGPSNKKINKYYILEEKIKFTQKTFIRQLKLKYLMTRGRLKQNDN